MSGGFDFTPEQSAAVNYRGGALLVSAAAGSGKTKVLVERLLGYISGGENIDRFLVITYTRAAASELREKILDEISERLSHEPENRHLCRQSMLCFEAEIGTIHGFCTALIRENAHVLGLAPNFRVADESESGVIKAEALDEVLNAAYDTIEKTPGFKALVDAMSGGRDDSKLVSIILDTHTKLQSAPDAAKWFRTQSARLSMDGVCDVSETIWGEVLLGSARRTAEFWRGEMLSAREEMRGLPELEKAYGASFEATISCIEAFVEALGRGWDEARKYSEINFPTGRVKGYDEFKDIRKRCKAAMDKLADMFECSSEELISDMRAVSPAVSALFDTIQEFDRAYSEEKRRRGVIDFSDEEHMALSLLTDSETGERTPLALAVGRRYREVMVDEYQDVNAVQELIMNAVSGGGKNLFMVGDVKQSIYRFRLADPSIFLRKYRSFNDAAPREDTNEDTSEEGARILLSKNFRSRAGILDAVNFVFKNIMSVEFGEMDYTPREYLIHGRNGGECGDAAVELDIIDMSAVERDEESPAKTRSEALFVAQRIAELVRGCFIPDGHGGERLVEYSDIVILLRSVSGKAWQFTGALAEFGIPSDTPGGEDFSDTAEISAAMSLLSVIDNPMQDIPLISALRSPVYGFTADELAEIRAASPDTDFYGALLHAAQTDEKSAAFLRELDEFRAVAPDMPADRLIWRVYNKTGMPGAFGAMRGGVRRRDNLMRLVEYARTFEASGYKGLFAFISHMRKLMERGAIQPPGTDGLAQNAVRIMSIHKSKGLEFPVVILADTAKQFNRKDMQKPLTVHPELGVGAMMVDANRRIIYPTLGRMAVQKKLTSEMLAEEMRVLYVAMTRAREKLIITAAFADAAKELSRISKNARVYIPPQALEDAKSLADWILMPALTRPEAFFLTDGQKSTGAHAGKCWDFRLIPAASAPPGYVSEVSGAETAEEARPEDIRLLRERFSFKYPYPGAEKLPSKLTVTGLKGRLTDYEAAEDAEIRDAGVAGRDAPFARPGFITERTRLTGAERGTALHLAMRYADFEKCAQGGIEEELESLVDRRLITRAQADAIDIKKLAAFFVSDLGRRVLRAERVEREFKFSLLRPAGEFFPGGGNEEILFQGVVDCFFEEDGKLTVIDFKTDYVTNESLLEKARQYGEQIGAYSAALERITGKRVGEKLLYFFELDAAVRCREKNDFFS